MNTTRIFIFAAWLACFPPPMCLFGAEQPASSARKPNFVLILSDDQGWNGTSVQMDADIAESKSDFYQTPNLEKLAGQGMRFSNAYASSPVCSPTRYSLQTGKSTARHGWTKAAPVMTAGDNYPLIPPPIPRQFSASETTIAELLKKTGYATAHYGKWHLRGGGPGKHGYDEHDGDTGNQDAEAFGDPNPVDIFGISRRTIAFMEKQTAAGKPFYIQLSHHALHYPEQSLKTTQEKYRRLPPGQRHHDVFRAAMTENLDTGVGMVMNAIKRLGIADNTYLIYMSDNGGGGGSSNRPLVGGKGSLWEGGLRVPMIVRGPGILAGVVCDVPVVGHDLFPTFCELAGIADDVPEKIDGGSLVPLWTSRGTGKVQRSTEGLVFHFPHYQGRPENGPQSAIRLGDFKLLKFYEPGKVHLFDVSKDVGERHDLANEMPERVADLHRRLDTYLQAVEARMPKANPQYDPTRRSTSDRGHKRKEKDARGRGGQRKPEKGQRGRRIDNRTTRFIGSEAGKESPKTVSDFPPLAQAAIRETASAATGNKPNFVVILIDDLGWKDLGFMGNPFIETPSIDRMAAEGVVFTDAYANAPNCAPTRACLLTGQYTPRHGVYTVGESTRGDSRRNKLIPVKNRQFLPSDSITIAEALKPAGYKSACFGMWNLGRQREPHNMPPARGFDVFASPKALGYDEKPPPSTKHGQGGPVLSYFANARARGGYRDPKPREYLTDRLTDEAVQFIEANRERPFFLYLAHHAVHRPYDPKADLVAKYEKKAACGERGNPIYAAMVESVDQSVGRILDTLKELKLDENTVVVFFSDNGGDTGGGIGTNQPLRGGKGMLYEGGIRVPLVVRCPGIARKGMRCSTPVLGSDLYPTMLELADATPPRNHVVDGESLVPLIQVTGGLDRDAVFWHFPVYLGRTAPCGVIRMGDFKLIESFEDGQLELFNLKDDLSENQNLAGIMPQKAVLLQGRLKQWQASARAAVPTEPNPEYEPIPRGLQPKGKRQRDGGPPR